MPREGVARRALLGWITGYRREWLRPDVIAGLVVGSVVIPQCVAYAQIAGLPPEAGLMAAPGALIGYALLGSSRSLVVSATTATSAISAAAIGPLAHGDTARFAALSAALAIVAGLVLLAGGVLRLGVISEFVSKPVMTGFMFGLALTIMVGQAPKLLGVGESDGNFFPRLADLLGDLDSIHGGTLVVGLASIALLVGLTRFVPKLPATLVVLAAAIAISALFNLHRHGVAVVGHLPRALPDPAWPDVTAHDLAELIPAGFGVLLLSTEAAGIARTMAIEHHYTIDPNRELSAIGAGNIVSGLTSGFVQSGGASQSAAADRAGGQSQLATLVAAALILLTGAFLSPLFTDLPQATLAAIVIVAVASFVRVDELRRFARLRESAIVLSVLCLVGVLTLGVLPGLIVTAGLSLIVVIQRISRPGITTLPGAVGTVTLQPQGPLFYANAAAVRERALALAREAGAGTLILDLSQSTDLDVETLDMLAGLRDSVDLRLASVHPRAREMLRRAGLESLSAGEAHPPAPA
jgi:sulfate permease, SulP family